MSQNDTENRFDKRIPYRKKKNRRKISSVKKIFGKKFVTGKIIRHFLPTNFFVWLSENIN